MATDTAPIKVDAATDELVSHAAHVMSHSKKDIVDAAAREYIDAHRDEINADVKAALGKLNGSDAAAVAVMTGFSAEEIDQLRGLPLYVTTAGLVGPGRKIRFMASSSPSVRPTLRCLADLGVALPDIGKHLDEIDEPVIAVAQSIPERRDAGGAERVLAVTDRAWFATSDQRGTVTELRGDDLPGWVLPIRGRGGSGLPVAARVTAPSATSTRCLRRSAPLASPCHRCTCCWGRRGQAIRPCAAATEPPNARVRHEDLVPAACSTVTTSPGSDQAGSMRGASGGGSASSPRAVTSQGCH